MEDLGHILLECLSAGRTIVLPAIGTLRVERTEANFTSPTKVSAPSNKVAYTRKEFQQHESLVGVITRTARVDISEVERIYDRWIESCRRDDGSYDFSPAGVLDNGSFIPSEQLQSLLNPENMPAEVKVKGRHGKTRKTLLAVLTGILTVGAVWYLWVSDDIISRSTEPDPTVNRTTKVSRPIVPPDTQSASAASVETTETQPATGTGTRTAPNDGPQSELQLTLPSALIGRYILVAGVYSTDENADRFIAQDELKIGSDKYFKRPFGQGKIMVGALSSDNRETVAKFKRSLGEAGYELWIYDTRK